MTSPAEPASAPTASSVPGPPGGGGVGLLRGLLAEAVHFVLPRICLGCSEPVKAESGDGAGPHLGLCAPCRRLLRRREASACDLCGRSGTGDVPCADCRRRPVPWRRLAWAFHYRPPLDGVLTGLKFRRLEYLPAHLVDAAWPTLAGQLGDPGLDGPELDLVVPVPLHWRRRLERGYDQARGLADRVGERLGRPLVPALRRRRATPAQSLLDRSARRRNLEGAFVLRRGAAARIGGRRCLLVDDVFTTGATLEVASRALLQGGAGSVTALCVARTPIQAPENVKIA